MEKRMEKTDYKITEFHNSEFGSIRMIEDGGRLLFSGIDVAFALGYAKPRNAINVHCKGALKRGVLTSGGVQPMIFIFKNNILCIKILVRQPYISFIIFRVFQPYSFPLEP